MPFEEDLKQETREPDHVVYQKDGAIARIILNNPERANAQTSEMVHSVNEALDDAQYDYDIKVVIIKANGKGFCSGHVPDGSYPEFKAELEASGKVWRSAAQLFLWPVLKLWEFPKPVISQVHGYAIGGGTTWALIPEITVCSDDAWFQMPLVPGFGLPGSETMFEPWVFMNYKRAAEYLYTAQRSRPSRLSSSGWSTVLYRVTDWRPRSRNSLPRSPRRP